MPGITWPRWNQADSGLLPALGAAMWATWLSALADVAAFTFHLSSPPGLLWPLVWLLLLGGTFVGRLRGRLGRDRWLAAGGGLLGVLAAEWWLLYRATFGLLDPGWLGALAVQASQFDVAPLLVAALATFLWWRGLTIEWQSHETQMRVFVAGVLALGLSLYLATRWSPANLGELSLAIVIFLLTGWATLALASVAEAASLTAAGGRLTLSRYWLLAVATAIAVIFVVGLVLAGLVTPAAVSRLLGYLLPVVQLLRLALGYLLYAVAYVTFLIISPIFYWLQSLMHQATGQPETNAPLQPPSKNFVDQGGGAALSPLAELLLRGAILLCIIFLIGWVLAWALRRSSRTDEQGVRESRDLIWSWDLWRARWAELLARRARPVAFVSLAGPPDSPLVWVRTAYQRLLALALEQGRARQPGQTPLRYEPSLDEILPAETAAVAALTAAYDAARYGEQAPGPDELEALRLKVEHIAASKRTKA